MKIIIRLVIAEISNRVKIIANNFYTLILYDPSFSRILSFWIIHRLKDSKIFFQKFVIVSSWYQTVLSKTHNLSVRRQGFTDTSDFEKSEKKGDALQWKPKLVFSQGKFFSNVLGVKIFRGFLFLRLNYSLEEQLKVTYRNWKWQTVDQKSFILLQYAALQN